MQILTIESREIETQWHYSRVELGKINLVVGDSGTGKTRFLNTIFNLGRSAVGIQFTSTGYWDITVKQGESTYRWIIEAIRNSPSDELIVSSESLSRILEDGKEDNLVQRNSNSFYFGGKELPKLSRNVSSISLLRNEKTIEPLIRGFSNIIRRSFHDDALKHASAYESLDPEFIAQMGRERNLEKIFHSPFGLNVKLYIVSEFFRDVFSKLCNYYTSVFPFIVDFRVKDFSELRKGSSLPGKTPVFCVKEKNVRNWIELSQLSSGMQKVLLILTDSLLLPQGGIYLIDEYENSLGINAIDFLPNFLLTFEKEAQFILTSHHPYIINNIPFENWVILHRKGSEITTKYGNQVKERFSKSRQDAFIQLINDPFYREGIE